MRGGRGAGGAPGAPFVWAPVAGRAAEESPPPFCACPCFPPAPGPLSAGAAAAAAPRLLCWSGEARRGEGVGPGQAEGAIAGGCRSREVALLPASEGEEAARRRRGGRNLQSCPPTGGGVSAPGPGAAPAAAAAWRTRSCASCSSAA